MLVVSTWMWGNKYNDDDLEKLHGGLRRNLQQPFRFVVISDRVDEHKIYIHPTHGPLEAFEIYQQDRHLLGIKGCFARLRMFDTSWQSYIDLRPDDRLVCVDLDVVVTGPMDSVFERSESFLILQGANAVNPCPFNGSLMMLRPGFHENVWRDFTFEKAQKIPCHEFPDDQGWLWHIMPKAAGWQVGPESGVYAFQKPQWPKGTDLPVDARLVVFPGWRSPDRFANLDWIQKHWRKGK